MSSEAGRKYRSSTLGQTLGQVLLQLIEDGKISKREGVAILASFDEEMLSSVQQTSSSSLKEKITISADLDFYNCYDGLWRFSLANVTTTLPSVPSLGALRVLAEETPRIKKTRR